jgi:hypothetical protein
LGKWVPVAKDRGGLSKVDIAKSESAWTIRIASYATFTETDWGKSRLQLVGKDVDAKTYDRGFAEWKHGFANEYMMLYTEDGLLVIESYTIFNDRSGRSNYRDIERFRRL